MWALLVRATTIWREPRYRCNWDAVRGPEALVIAVGHVFAAMLKDDLLCTLEEAAVIAILVFDGDLEHNGSGCRLRTRRWPAKRRRRRPSRRISSSCKSFMLLFLWRRGVKMENRDVNVAESNSELATWRQSVCF